MNINQMEEKCSGIPHLAALPQTAEALFQLCTSRKVEPRMLYKMICLDPAIFCQTQFLFNKYYPKLNDRFYSIAEIIIMLNITTIKNYLAPFAFKTYNALCEKTISKKIIEKNNELFVHAVTIGIASRFIAGLRKTDVNQFEYYYAAGLLHDFGKFFLVDKSDNDDKDHPECGMAAAKALNLYSGLINVIAYHHDALEFRGRDIQLVQTVALAECWAHKKSNDLKLIEKLDIKPDYGAPLEKLVSRELKKINAFIKTGGQ